MNNNGHELAKSRTGIRGLDEITRGGLPAGRPTLVCGGPGSGKTLLALTFLVNGATRFDEPGVLMTFEENADEIASDVASLGFDLPKLIAAGRLAVDYVRVERAEIEETGEYDLEGLFVRLGYAIDSIGAKRVVLDTVESLFAGLKDDAILRSELRRLFRWLKDKGVTALITGERGDGLLTKQGLEASPARRQVPRLLSRHQRISVPHRRRGPQRTAGLLDGAAARGAARAHLRRNPESRRHAQREGLLPRQHRPRDRRSRHRQDEPGGALPRCGVPPR
jgi:KaiC/GvpD/RAD55 family RecA-like ATPase